MRERMVRRDGDKCGHVCETLQPPFLPLSLLPQIVRESPKFLIMANKVRQRRARGKVEQDDLCIVCLQLWQTVYPPLVRDRGIMVSR